MCNCTWRQWVWRHARQSQRGSGGLGRGAPMRGKRRCWRMQGSPYLSKSMRSLCDGGRQAGRGRIRRKLGSSRQAGIAQLRQDDTALSDPVCRLQPAIVLQLGLRLISCTIGVPEWLPSRPNLPWEWQSAFLHTSAFRGPRDALVRRDCFLCCIRGLIAWRCFGGPESKRSLQHQKQG